MNNSVCGSTIRGQLEIYLYKMGTNEDEVFCIELSNNASAEEAGDETGHIIVT